VSAAGSRSDSRYRDASARIETPSADQPSTGQLRPGQPRTTPRQMPRPREHPTSPQVRLTYTGTTHRAPASAGPDVRIQDGLNLGKRLGHARPVHPAPDYLTHHRPPPSGLAASRWAESSISAPTPTPVGTPLPGTKRRHEFVRPLPGRQLCSSPDTAGEPSAPTLQPPGPPGVD
jgi:hypothetical protein